MTTRLRPSSPASLSTFNSEGLERPDSDNSPATCEMCGKPLEEAEKLVCKDRVACSERRQFQRTEEGM